MTLCQKDMEEGLEYICPFDGRGFAGPIGRRNLRIHVQTYHPEQYKSFSEKNIEDFKMTKKMKEEKSEVKTSETDSVEIPLHEQNLLKTEQPPLTTEQNLLKTEQPPLTTEQNPEHPPKIPKYQQKPSYQEKPEWQVEEPEEWLEAFLRAYKFKEMFIRIQVEQVRQTKELPYAGSLFQDMQTMDSGVINKPTISWIVQQYERQVKQYMRKYEELMNTMNRRGGGYPMQEYSGGSYQDTYPSVPTHRGMPVGRQPEYRRKDVSYHETDRIARLEDELRRRDEERNRQTEYNYNNLKMKVEQGQTRQEDPALLRLQQQLETQATETRKLTAELAAQKESTLLERIARIEQHAGGPSAEQLQRYIDQAIQAEHDKVTASDLDRKIKQAINASQGITTMDVEMKKIDKQYDIDQRKLEMEEKKGSMWGDTLKDVAGLVGEGFGKGMSGAGQPQAENQPQTPPVSCPHCGKPLMLPPGVKFGVCPYCNGKMEIGTDGPAPFNEPTPQQPTPPLESEPEPLESDKEPEYTGTFNKPFNKPVRVPQSAAEPTEEQPLGICPVCGKPVYDSNIGKTEDGKSYHKECC